jgi:hypothetical protein
MIDFFDLSYLSTGSAVQKRAYQALKALQVFERFAPFKPALAGTIPLDIALPDSDLDILCEVHDMGAFDRAALTHFGQMDGYSSQRKIHQGVLASIHRFTASGFAIELFGQPIPVVEQRAFRHLLLEARLLEMGGDAARGQILAYKREGMKTEEAFARYFGLEGHPSLSLD